MHRKAEKFLERAPRDVQRRVESALLDLSVKPRKGDKHLKDDYHCFWRRRVGDIRIIYSVSDAEKKVYVVSICWRRSCY